MKMKNLLWVLMLFALVACGDSDNSDDDIVYGDPVAGLYIAVVDGDGNNLLSGDIDKCCIAKKQYNGNGMYTFNRLFKDGQMNVSAVFNAENNCLQISELMPELLCNGTLMIEMNDGNIVELECFYGKEDYKKGWRYNLFVNGVEADRIPHKDEMVLNNYYCSRFSYTIVLN